MNSHIITQVFPLKQLYSVPSLKIDKPSEADMFLSTEERDCMTVCASSTLVD